MQPFSAEHIQPRSRSGRKLLRNLAWACQGCNGHKYYKTSARDPITGAIVLLFHPRKQQWSEHIAWNDGYTLILGLTPTGRATIRALHLNRLGL